MIWFDTHCHLDCEPLSEHLADVVARARAAGVEGMVIPGIEGPVDKKGLPEMALRAWGIHPENAHKYRPDDVRQKFLASGYSPVAIGECGLDSHGQGSLEHQENLFVLQIRLAHEYGLPLLIHLRGCWEKALKLLKAHGRGIPWVMHAFSGSAEMARLFLAEGAYISFAGSLCFKNARKTPQVALLVPEDRILLETDAPDMRPPGWKGLFNEPAALPEIGAFLAALRGCQVDKLAEQIRRNGSRIFGDRKIPLTDSADKG